MRCENCRFAKINWRKGDTKAQLRQASDRAQERIDTALTLYHKAKEE